MWRGLISLACARLIFHCCGTGEEFGENKFHETCSLNLNTYQDARGEKTSCTRYRVRRPQDQAAWAGDQAEWAGGRLDRVDRGAKQLMIEGGGGLTLRQVRTGDRSITGGANTGGVGRMRGA